MNAKSGWREEQEGWRGIVVKPVKIENRNLDAKDEKRMVCRGLCDLSRGKGKRVL